jgi:eight-cysteine-cluster-containing protein
MNMTRQRRSWLGPALLAACMLPSAGAQARRQATQDSQPQQTQAARQNAGPEKAPCPEGWYDATTTEILCIQGMQPVVRTIAGARCVRCLSAKAATPRCEGVWHPAEAEFGCAPGYEMAYNQDGSCKRCKAAQAGCKRDADCMRTGCSGQICASEPLATTCEWREEYACYRESFAQCACINGSCGWAPNPELLQCVSQAQAGTSSTGGTNPSPVERPQSP